jgi:hypothetical protein
MEWYVFQNKAMLYQKWILKEYTSFSLKERVSEG